MSDTLWAYVMSGYVCFLALCRLILYWLRSNIGFFIKFELNLLNVFASQHLFMKKKKTLLNENWPQTPQKQGCPPSFLIRLAYFSHSNMKTFWWNMGTCFKPQCALDCWHHQQLAALPAVFRQASMQKQTEVIIIH